MANCFQLSVITAGGALLEGRASACRLPVEGGSVGILARHAPMLCALREGEAIFRMEDGDEKRFHLCGGVADVHDNAVTVLAEQAQLCQTEE